MNISATTIIGLLQTFLVIAGVLFTGASVKLNTLGGEPPPALPQWIRDNGYTLLLVPLFWTLASIIFRASRFEAYRAQKINMGLGIALLALFFLLGIAGFSIPFVRI